MFSQAENQIFWFESFLERTWNSSAALTVAETLVWFLTVEQQLSTTGNVWFYPDQHKTAHLHWQVQSWLNTNVKHHLIIVMMLPYGLGKWECSVFMHVLVFKKKLFLEGEKLKMKPMRGDVLLPLSPSLTTKSSSTSMTEVFISF